MSREKGRGGRDSIAIIASFRNNLKQALRCARFRLDCRNHRQIGAFRASSRHGEAAEIPSDRTRQVQLGSKQR